MTYIKMI